MPRLNARSDARDGGATSSDIRTRHPALEPRVSASACTDLRGNAMRRGSAIRKGQKFLVRRMKPRKRVPILDGDIVVRDSLGELFMLDVKLFTQFL